MKTLGFRKYNVYVKEQDNVTQIAVPARDEGEAKLYFNDVDKIIEIQDITDRTPISVDKVQVALHRYGFHKTEIDIIAKILLLTNIAD